MKEILETVVQGGALGLLALLLGGGIYIVAAVIPAARSFFERLTAPLGGLETRTAVIEAKLDAVSVRVDKVNDAVAAEALEVRVAVGDAERRVVKAVQREQASDPPAAPSRPSFHTAVAAGARR